MRSLRIDIGMNAQQPFPGIFQLALHCAPHQFLDFRGGERAVYFYHHRFDVPLLNLHHHRKLRPQHTVAEVPAEGVSQSCCRGRKLVKITVFQRYPDYPCKGG